MNVGIVGFGYWGKNLVRNFYQLGDCELKVVCELDTSKHEVFKKQYPGVEITDDFDSVIARQEIDALVIATPVNTHYPLARAALKAGKHVLVEKPLASSFDHAHELVELARSQNRVLMVDHTFIYTSAVRLIKKVVSRGDLGQINYVDSTRVNLGLFQHDVNVLWDLAPHDISICTYLIEKRPVSVQATGVSHLNNNIENIAYLTLKYENNMIAHFSCSWVSPLKIRQMLIGGDKKMILYDDNEPTEKIKIYDTGYEAKTDQDRTNLMIDYRTGDIHVPKVDRTEALSLMAQDFIHSIKSGKEPDSDAQLGLHVVEVLDAAQQSIEQNGKEIMLP